LSFDPTLAGFPLDLSLGIITVHARLYGPRVCRLIRLGLDTGASSTVISSRLILELGYDLKNSRSHADLTTATGGIAAPLITLRQFHCLGKKIPRFRVACHDLPSELMIEGLLGLDFLRRYDVLLRFKSRRIELL